MPHIAPSSSSPPTGSGGRIKRRYQIQLAKHGLTVATLEGRGDSWSPEKHSRPRLCKNLEAVGLAILAKEDVRSAVCGKANGKRCPFYEGCGYLTQYAEAASADVLIVAHEFIFETLPPSVVHDLATVTVEEEGSVAKSVFCCHTAII